MILIVNLCEERLSYYEFVKPIEEIVEKNYFVKKYDEIDKKDLEKADKVIICGTSLADNNFLNKLKAFFWIKNFEKPIFGICAGFQIIQLIFDGKMKKIKEIGPIKINFEKSFLGFIGKKEVYSLHQNFVFSSDFEVYAKSLNCIHAVKHKEKEIYATLFHPEVYNRELIENFLRL